MCGKIAACAGLKKVDSQSVFVVYHHSREGRRLLSFENICLVVSRVSVCGVHAACAGLKTVGSWYFCICIYIYTYLSIYLSIYISTYISISVSLNKLSLLSAPPHPCGCVPKSRCLLRFYFFVALFAHTHTFCTYSHGSEACCIAGKGIKGWV